MFSPLKNISILRNNFKVVTVRCSSSNIRFKSSNCKIGANEVRKFRFHKRTWSNAAVVQSPTNLSQEEIKSFIDTIPNLFEDLVDKEIFANFTDWSKKFNRLIEYTSIADSKRGTLTSLSVYKMLNKTENVTEENLKIAYALAGCIEMLQVVVLMVRHFVEGIDIRNNLQTWHTNEDVRMQLCNDATFLENVIFRVLNKYLASHSCYGQILELFHNTLYKTFQGESLHATRCSIELMTVDLMKTIAEYQFGYKWYILPVYSAAYLAKFQNLCEDHNIKSILLEMARYSKIESDFLDSFGDSEVSGHNNIRNSRCSWLALTAFQKASEPQRSILKKHYGCTEKLSIDKVVNLYEELNIPAEFENYKETCFNRITSQIQEIPTKLQRNVLEYIVKQFDFSRQF